MPTILIKKSDTASAVPGTANLTNLAGGAEVAVNTADRRMFTMNSSSAVVELGTNPSSLTCADGSFTLLKAASASITNLTATSLVLSNLSIASANVTTLTSASATITNLLATSLTVSGNTFLATSSGNVGIGTSSPGAKLDVNGGTNSEMRLTTSGSGYLQVGQFSNGAFIGTSSTDATAGILRFGTGGTERMRLDSSGNLGIGTSSPAGKVHAYSTSGFAAPPLLCADAVSNFRVVFNTSTYAGVPANKPWLHSYDDIYIGSDSGVACKWMSGGTNTMTLTSSGNLGLGVTPGTWTLSGAAAIQNKNAGWMGYLNNSYLTANATNAAGDWKYIATAVANLYAMESGAHKWYYAPSGTAGNTISFTQAMTLTAGGELWLGTSSGATSSNYRIFEIAGKAGLFGPQIKFTSGDGTNTGLLFLDVNGLCSGTDGAYPVRFYTSGSERARITSGGDFFVNCSSGNGKLTVRGPGTTTGYSFEAANSAGSTRFLVSDNGLIQFYKSDNAESARITSGGDLLVGTTSTNGKFTVLTDSASVIAGSFENNAATPTAAGLLVNFSNGTGTNNGTAVLYRGRSAGGDRFYVYGNGNVVNTNGSYGTISDAKMKADIVDAGSQWDDIKAVRFRKFKMKDDPADLVQLGVVAQELEQTSPGLVDEHTDRDAEGNDLGTTTKSVKTSVLLMKAAVALQEAMARIEQLEAKVAALETK